MYTASSHTTISTDSLTTSFPQKPNYRQFYRPFAKVFLGAMFTYQVLFWCWEKLRLDEMREEKEAELKGLETQLAAYQDKQRLDKEKDTAQTGKKSWFSW